MACRCFSMYWNLDFATGGNFTASEVYFDGVRRVIQILGEHELPVKLEAALALKRLLQSAAVVELVKPIVGVVFENYFAIMAEFDSEELIEALGRMILLFEDEIVPHALSICNKLASHFLEVADADPEDLEAAAAAAETIQVINNVMLTLEDQPPEVFAEIEKIIYPVAVKVLSDIDQIEYLQGTLELLGPVTYSSPISKEFWELFPLLCSAVRQFGTDQFGFFVASFDTFISRSTEVFLSNGHYFQMIWEII